MWRGIKRYMVSVDKFLQDCKQPVEKINRPLSSEDEKVKIEIIQYLLNHKTEVNYTEKIFNKLEIILNDLLGGQ